MQPVGQRLVRQTGYRGATIIDDTYNANPLSMRAALNVLAQCAGETIFVMGEMGELGEVAADCHAKIGAQAKQLGIDRLLTQGGHLAEQASRAFGESAAYFADPSALIRALRPLLGDNTTVLVKGSRTARMETVVEAIT